MARQLWLFRHADAEPHGGREDSARRLTERGEEQARVAGTALARMGLGFEAVLYSPKVRARQTAEIAAEEWPEEEREKLAVYEPLTGGFDAGRALDVISGISPDGRLMLIGHEPDLSRTAGELTGGSIDLKKGGLAIVRLEGAAGELAVLLRPRELALIAGVPVGAGAPPVGGD
jgi:phosphohistidine phosphatase